MDLGDQPVSGDPRQASSGLGLKVWVGAGLGFGLVLREGVGGYLTRDLAWSDVGIN